MGKPAARALVDTGAHVGPVMTGSANVLIGGMPAARKGDAVTCSLHGSAAIIEGSATVFINGISAARMGDKTSCGTPPAPAPAGPAPAADTFHFATPVKDSNPDGTVKTTQPDHINMKVLNAYANFKDKTKDGSLDYMTTGVVLTEFTAKGDYKVMGNEHLNIGGSTGFSVLKAEGKGGLYGSNGVYGGEAEGKATVSSKNAEAHFGKEGALYHKSEVKGDVLYAEGKADAQLYTGGSDHKYGVQGELSGDAGLVKAEYEGQSDMWLISTKAKIGLMGGNAALGGKGGFFVDTDDYQVSANVGGKIALLIGLKADLEITIKLKPLVDAYDYFFPSVFPGVVITGCPTVLIG
jgi:uncharacterized Zn-binding protein involved in type VI secretion